MRWLRMPMKLPKGITPRKFARMLQEWRARKGYSQRDASNALGISKRTVDVHRSNIMEKLQIDNIADLIKFSISQGLI